jgi:hypothetical protein
MSDQPTAEVASYTTQQTQETNIHALSRIQTHDRSNQAAADQCLRLQSHQLQLGFNLTLVHKPQLSLRFS